MDKAVSTKPKNEIFLRIGLDSKFARQPVGQISRVDLSGKREISSTSTPIPRDLAYSLDKMRTRGSGVEPISKILRFVGHQSFAEFHDAHRVRRYAVIGKNEFCDP